MRHLLMGLALCLALISLSDATSTPILFQDVGQSCGLSAQNVYGGQAHKDFILETTGNGAAVFDFDDDGRDDLFINNGTTLDGKASGRPALYRNEGNGRFRDVTQRAGLRAVGWGQGVCAGDYDNDGHTDLLLTAYGHNTLYRNRGDGSFEDVTERAHLPVTGTRYGAGCSFVDYDRDGKLDLLVSNYVNLDLKNTPHPGTGEFCQWKNIPVMCGPRGLPLASNVLYHNEGDGTFRDVSEQAGILKAGGRYGLSTVAADFDNDGWPDLYVACDMTPSLLFRNRHDGTFEEVGAEAGVAFNYDGALQAGMGVAVADFDGDGLLDIAKTNFSGDLPSLFHNDDGKFFTDLSRKAGLGTKQLLGWGIAFLDVDDDGWRDLVIANGHVYPEVEGKSLGDTYRQQTLLYRNRGDGHFEDITASAGPAFQTPRPARGLATGDLDGDGRPEIVIVNMNDRPSLLKNNGHSKGHYLNLTMKGTRSNRSAIGARATVVAGGRRLLDEVMSGGSYYSQNSFSLHFGLGDVARVDAIEIRWPSGVTEKLPGMAADQTVRVVEGEGVKP